MAFEGYMSCGACHFEGDDDGRVYDFSTRGEGLRNTPALLGRKGSGHGRLNWSGTLDEVQDFEHRIRELFEGTGFLSDDVFHVGTRDQPLGDAKVGLSADLDALAAYVTSLDQVNPSPYRNPDGSLTADGIAGKAVFAKLGCDFCHGGAEFTDSARGRLHDVGTITALSGMHAGGPLLGIDTPTLLGVWETPPYLHDGSAATLRDVLTTRNPADLHGYVSALPSQQVDQLVAYLLQINGDPPVTRFPFDPPWQGGDGGITGGGERPGPSGGGCACAMQAGDERTIPRATYLGLGVLGLALMRRRGRVRGAQPTSAVLALLLLVLFTMGCRPDEPGGGEAARGGCRPTGRRCRPRRRARTRARAAWRPPEQPTIGSARVAAATASPSVLCGGGRRPEIRDMAELLALVGLADRRAFALTGNSTSLVADERVGNQPAGILVFPRVGADLKQPGSMTAVGFVRGEPFVELVSRDPSSGDLNFYLLSFRAAVQLRRRRLRSGERSHRGARARLDRLQRLRSGRPRSHVVRLPIRVINRPGPTRIESCACRSSQPLDALVSAAVRAAHRLGPGARHGSSRSPPLDKQYGGIPIG